MLPASSSYCSTSHFSFNIHNQKPSSTFSLVNILDYYTFSLANNKALFTFLLANINAYEKSAGCMWPFNRRSFQNKTFISSNQTWLIPFLYALQTPSKHKAQSLLTRLKMEKHSSGFSEQTLHARDRESELLLWTQQWSIVKSRDTIILFYGQSTSARMRSNCIQSTASTWPIRSQITPGQNIRWLRSCGRKIYK